MSNIARKEKAARKEEADWAVRNEISGDVYNGRISPSEAEAKAAELGIGPLASCPKPDLFNPLGDRFVTWSLPMALDWIVWRDPSSVMRQCDAYRAQCWEWIPRQPKTPQEASPGCELTPLGNARATFIVSAEDGAYPTPEQLEAAEAALRAKLVSGEIGALGINNRSGGDPQVIPRELWLKLTHDTQGKRPSAVCMDGAVRFYDVQLDRSEILKHWPVPGTRSLQPLNQKRAEKLVADYLQEAEQAGSQHSQSGAEKYVQERGYKGREHIRNAYKKLTGGLSRGRPRKK